MIQDEPVRTDKTTRALHVEVVHDPNAFIALRDEWEALLARASRATAFQSPDWLGTWWRIISSWSELWLLLVRDADGTLIGLAPLQMERYGIWPLRLRLLRWLGHGHRIGTLTEMLGPIFAAGHETETTRAVLDSLHMRAHDWDLLDLIRTPNPLAQEFLAWARDVGYCGKIYDSSSWLYIRLPGDWPSLQRTLSKNLRRDLSYYRNRLHREGHSESIVVLTEPEALMGALPQFFELHQLRAHAQNMEKHDNYFAEPANRVFATEIARVLSTQGRLALAQIVVDGAVVAAQLLLFQGQVMTVYYSGFDPEWSRHRVMKLLTQGCVEYAIAHGMRWIDLTAGASQTKRQWGNEEVLTDRVQVAQPSSVNAFGAWAIRTKVIQSHKLDSIRRSWYKTHKTMG